MNLTKKIFQISFIFCLSILAFTSCNKDDVTPSSNQNTQQDASFARNVNTNNANLTLDEDSCFAINYPIDIIYPDGSTQTVSSDDELEISIDDWYDQNEDSEEDITLAFPITVTLPDGSTQTINDEDTLCDLYYECYGDDDDDEDDWDEDCVDVYEDCFTLIYPATVVLPNGTSATVNDDEELEDFVEDWYEQNEDSEEDPTFEYPINVLLADSTTQVINNDIELEALFETCEDLYDECDDDFDEECIDDYDDCFELNYPITILLPDGTSSSVNDDDELEDFVEDWYENNPNSDDDPTFDYPITVTLEDDGSTQTINDDDELEDLFDSCE